MGNEVTGLEEFTPMWGGGAAPIGIMPPQRAPDPMAVQEEVAPEDPVDYFTRKFPPQTEWDRDSLKYEQDMWYEAYSDQVNDHQFTNLEEYIDFVEGLTTPTGQPFSPAIDAFKRKVAFDYKQPAVGSDLAERKEARKIDQKEQTQAAKIDKLNTEFYEKHGMLMGPDGKVIKIPSRAEKMRDLAKLPLEMLKQHESMKPLYVPSGEDKDSQAKSQNEYSQALNEWKTEGMQYQQDYRDALRQAQQALMDEQSGGGGGNQNNEAVQWAEANPNDPRSARILQLNGR